MKLVSKLRDIRTSATRLLLALFAIAALSGCSTTDRMSTFDTKGPIAEMQEDVFMVTLWLSLFLFITVGGSYAFALFKYRERKSERGALPPSQSHGNPIVEMGLIAFAVLCLVVIAVPTLKGIWLQEEMPEHPDSIEIQANGWQWWWSFDYEEGFSTGNEMVIPAGVPVRLELRSKDVIHSFWLPKIAGKVDVIPGRKNWMWIQAGHSFEDWKERHQDDFQSQDEATLKAGYQAYLEEEIVGHYYGQCAEYCGEAHAYMLFRCQVVMPEKYKEWVAQQQEEAKVPPGFTSWEEFRSQYITMEGLPKEPWPASAPTDGESPTAVVDVAALSQEEKDQRIVDGARLFMTQGTCVRCHTLRGPGALGPLGPELTHVGSRYSLGAGIMDNRVGYNQEERPGPGPYNEGWEGRIDPAIQRENLIDWIWASEHIKPGNLMYPSIHQVILPTKEEQQIIRLSEQIVERDIVMEDKANDPSWVERTLREHGFDVTPAPKLGDVMEEISTAFILKQAGEDLAAETGEFEQLTDEELAEIQATDLDETAFRSEYQARRIGQVDEQNRQRLLSKVRSEEEIQAPKLSKDQIARIAEFLASLNSVTAKEG